MICRDYQQQDNTTQMQQYILHSISQTTAKFLEWKYFLLKQKLRSYNQFLQGGKSVFWLQKKWPIVISREGFCWISIWSAVCLLPISLKSCPSNFAEADILNFFIVISIRILVLLRTRWWPSFSYNKVLFTGRQIFLYFHISSCPSTL